MSKEYYPAESAMRKTLEALGVGTKITYAIAKPVFQETGKVVGYYAGRAIDKRLEKVGFKWRRMRNDIFPRNNTPRYYKKP